MQDLEDESSASQASRSAVPPVAPAKMDWQDVSDELATLAVIAAQAALSHMSRSTSLGPLHGYNQARQRNWASGARSRPNASLAGAKVADVVSSLLEESGGHKGPGRAGQSQSNAAPSGQLQLDSEPNAGGSMSDGDSSHASEGASGPTDVGDAGLPRETVNNPASPLNSQAAEEGAVLAARPVRSNVGSASRQRLRAQADSSKAQTFALQTAKQLGQLRKHELQDKCREQGMPTHGSKQDLVKRLIDHRESL